MSTTVVIPTFNEKESIEKTILKIFSTTSNINVLVVDDNSPDGTAKVVEKLQKTNPRLFLIKRLEKNGRGSAVMAGFKFALEKLSPEILIEMDADLSHPPKEIPQLIKDSRLKTVVVASRYLKGSQIIGWPFIRLRASQLVNFLIRLLLGNPLKDNTNGFRAYPKEAIEILINHHFISRGFILLSETTKILTNSGFKFKEIPTTFVDRKLGKSNATLAEFFGSLKALIMMNAYFKPWIKDLFFLALLLIFLKITYWELLKNFTSLTFGHDLGTNWIYAQYFKESFQEFGQFPLWQTGFLSGFPIDASNIAGIFYPFHWLFFFLPLKIAFNLLTMLHIFLIGAFGYFLTAYGFKLSRASSFVAALALMLSPRWMNHNYLGHINLIESIPWLVLSLLTFIKTLEKKSLYLAVLTGLILALIINVFSIFYIYALFALGLYLIFHFSLKGAFLTTASVISSLIFSNIFLLPFLNFSPESLRTRLGFWDGAFPSIYQESLLELLEIFPQRFHSSETLLYIGIPTLLLAIIGIITHWKNKKVFFLLFLSIFALTVSFGANEIFYKIYYQLIPVFHFMRSPVRIWALFIIGMGLLSGFGFEYLIKKFPAKKLFLTLTAAVLIFLSLWVYNKNYFLFSNLENPTNKIVKELPKENFRIYCLNNCLLEPYTFSKGWQLSSGAEVVLLNSYYDFMKLAGGYNFHAYSLSIPPYQVFDAKGIYFEKQTPNPKLLGITNTKFVISPYELTDKDFKLLAKTSDYYLYENLSVLPKAFSVPKANYYLKEEELLKGDFKRAVYLKGSGKNLENPGGFKEEAIKFYSPNKISLEVNLENKGFLVLSELYYQGWKAFVDNQEVPILKANGAVRSIALEPGKHKVEFNYFPDSLKLGIAITFLSLTFFIIASLWKWRHFRSLFSHFR